jgi:YgiT-type zinc finger domain-containing protein
MGKKKVPSLFFPLFESRTRHVVHSGLGKTINMRTSTLRRCPSCGSRRIRRMKKSFRAKVGTRTVTIPDLEREICPVCKEEFFDREANTVIDAYCFGKNKKRA